ncbi:glycerophosphodiester phosphodiesterase [Erythrobacter sp. QSSC1-22B]|uniref:glycerophosphodiester phosphodiesterase family protein n=1 Tax=Erythrobacter sp. QSSC1-22B TaxID=1860125 RepID=UPI000805B19E|nr:glycerophosphodiester phosphodiesterase family protein [Erythrobacter sp. QSSC1-22B]OBX19726.1 glycerophosphodiester phosphodiesterase [Erythrobacter sp. QSSC1-22B]
MGRRFLIAAAAALAALAAPPLVAQPAGEGMLVIAHRGASGERPEHTLAAYERAIDAGADYIEPDLVATSDLVLVARHENELSDTTDVASREEFEDRRRSKEIDGQLVSGWFAEDFTLAELRTLRVVERLPSVRPGNVGYDTLYQIPTFAEIVRLVRAKEAETGRTIGIYPELKHPNFLLQYEGIDTVDLLVLALREAGYAGADAPVFLQSFEIAPLKRLAQRTDFRLIQLVAPEGGPADEPAMRYSEMLTPTGLAEIATYADGIGAAIPLLLAPDGSATPVVADAKAAGLAVHAWTLRKENVFLPAPLRLGTNEGTIGCDATLYAMLAAAGIDGVFADDPARALDWRGGAAQPGCAMPGGAR